jgi:SAM-dependent methyltransferase
MHEGDLTTLDLPREAYDVVTLFDVIEHVSDPLATLRSAYRLIRPGGLLHMDTPHFYSIPYLLFRKEWTVFFPWHRAYFSARNMRIALEMAGFNVKHISAVGLLPFSRYSPWGFGSIGERRSARRCFTDEPLIRPSSSATKTRCARSGWLSNARRKRRSVYCPVWESTSARN